MNHHNKKPSTILLLMTTVMLMSCAASDATGNPTSLSSAPEATTPEATIPVAVSSLSSTDVEGRLSSLEQKVGTLESDMNDAKPTLAKVAVIERQFRSLSLELDRIDQEQLLPAKISNEKISTSAPMVKEKSRATETPKPKEPVKTKSSRTTGAAEVTGVRFGSQNSNSTRIVVDGGKPVSMTADLDNNEKILVLEIKGLDWKAATNRPSISSPLVASYTAQNTENGSRLVLQLKRGVKIGKVQSLSPEGSNGHRAFLDLTAQ
jgi:hypothetical protein